MAKSKTPRLKVFQAQFGFYDTIVAAPSRAAALRAWGLRQDVFADGQAKQITEPQAIAAAVARPQTVLKRPVGSSGPFEVEPTGLPDVPEPPSRTISSAPARGGKKGESPPSPPADRSRLDAAETALRELDERRKAEEAGLQREADALEARRAVAQKAYVDARKAMAATVVQARSDYRKAGGRD